MGTPGYFKAPTEQLEDLMPLCSPVLSHTDGIKILGRLHICDVDELYRCGYVGTVIKALSTSWSTVSLVLSIRHGASRSASPTIGGVRMASTRGGSVSPSLAIGAG